MKEAIKEDLIEALRSGDHFQCEGALENANGEQCCLGVLCDIMDVPRHVVTYPGSRLVSIYYGRDEPDFDEIVGNRWADTALPREIMEEAGLSDTEMGVLMSLNDDGYSFWAIADYVEAVL